jgi:hypothetical protein
VGSVRVACGMVWEIGVVRPSGSTRAIAGIVWKNRVGASGRGPE